MLDSLAAHWAGLVGACTANHMYASNWQIPPEHVRFRPTEAIAVSKMPGVTEFIQVCTNGQKRPFRNDSDTITQFLIFSVLMAHVQNLIVCSG